MRVCTAQHPLPHRIFFIFLKMCSPPSVGSMIFEVAPKLFASKMPLFGPSKRRDESFVGHLVRYNRSTARSVRLFSPTVGYLGDSRGGKIRHKNVYFLLTASLDQSFRHFIKNDCFITLTTMWIFCALLLFLCALMALHIFFFENLGVFSEICSLPRQEPWFWRLHGCKIMRKVIFGSPIWPKSAVLGIHVAIQNLQISLQKCVFPVYGLS